MVYIYQCDYVIHLSDGMNGGRGIAIVDGVTENGDVVTENGYVSSLEMRDDLVDIYNASENELMTGMQFMLCMIRTAMPAGVVCNAGDCQC